MKEPVTLSGTKERKDEIDFSPGTDGGTDENGDEKIQIRQEEDVAVPF